MYEHRSPRRFIKRTKSHTSIVMPSITHTHLFLHVHRERSRPQKHLIQKMRDRRSLASSKLSLNMNPYYNLGERLLFPDFKLNRGEWDILFYSF